VELSGWGRYPRHDSMLVHAGEPGRLAALLCGLPAHVARGNGRAYGDAAVGVEATLDTRNLDRMRNFDAAAGLLSVEAGVLLSDIVEAFLPRGYFPPVVPGTRFVTVGGMIAADVHGKNHHRDGGFGEHVESFRLVLPSGETVSCSRGENPDLFRATVGGMGLTGTIVEATLRMRRVETGWIRQRTLRAANLAAALAALEANSGSSYSVAWIDCLAKGKELGRSLVYLGEHASLEEVRSAKPSTAAYPAGSRRTFTVPADVPSFVLNRHSIRAFNAIKFLREAAGGEAEAIIPWDRYFFPLDGLAGWNRLYGQRGFLQYQCVIPNTKAVPVLGEILGEISSSGEAPFLAVLKTLGAAGGLMSFPMPGATLALDFPVTDRVFPFLDRIDRLVSAAGGRLYLAKDARQRPETFEEGYPGLRSFKELRRFIGADKRLASMLSRRLAI
jgi:decaprenylphospho-beta-D-ribofuranose 2-oxidase